MKKTFVILVALICSLSTPLWATEIKFNNQHIKQGHTLRIDLYPKHALKSGQVSFLSRNYPIFKRKSKQGHHYTTYIGISRNKKPGKFPLTITLKNAKNTPHKHSYTITITDANFPVQHITLPPQKKKLAKKRKQLSNEATLITKKFKTQSTASYINRPFILPLKGRISSEFGAYRIYNGTRQSRRHSGTDIAEKTGRPIKAPQSGKVILSATLKSHGNTIIIDHGMGILSIYNHLNKRLVKENDVVKQGNVIGHVGMTGIATGPHLHWGLSIHNTRVNPMEWVNNRTLSK